jgi:hypothetical protein
MTGGLQKNGGDFTFDGRVDIYDINVLAVECWLALDDLAPTPNPSQWQTEPYHSSGTSITMAAVTAYDSWGQYWDWDVEYYFDCIFGNCHDRDWDTSPTYTDTELTPNAEYGYRVRTRDGYPFIPEEEITRLGLSDEDIAEMSDEDIERLRGNKTDWSPISYSGGPDTTPPAPAPILESIEADVNSITMAATTAFDDSGVEYYFDSVTIGGHDSGWLDEPNYTDPNLTPDTLYCYRVMARDLSPRRNETDWSEIIYISTLPPEDVNAPTPNPMQWDTTVDANGFDGRPHEIQRGTSSTTSFYAEMTAVVATDDSGGTVWYYFECTTESGFSSSDYNGDWITDNTYTVRVGRGNQLHTFRVKAKDEFGNETEWSTTEVTATEPREDEGAF